MKPGQQPKLCFLVALLACALPLKIFGHAAGLSTSDCKFGTNGLKVELTFAVADLLAGLAHIETSTPLDADRNGQLTQAEFNGGLQRLKTFATDALTVEFDGQRIPATLRQLALDETNNFHLQLDYVAPRPNRLLITATLFRDLPSDHRHFVGVQDLDEKMLGSQMLYPIANSLEVTLTGDSTGAKPERSQTTFSGFFLLGIKHIWTGYDHLLFLLAVLLVCDRFKAAVQVVTCFTVAHSITLALATFNLVAVSSQLVEPLIAASIIYVGVENFFVPEGRQGRWLITFFFGLIHGLGFATILRDMGVSSSATGATIPLIAFNLGVEAGQLAVAAVLLPLLWQLRRSKHFLPRGLRACSVVVAALGAYWLVQRLWFG